MRGFLRELALWLAVTAAFAVVLILFLLVGGIGVDPLLRP